MPSLWAGAVLGLLIPAVLVTAALSGRAGVRDLLRGTGDSLLLVALLHSVFNRTNNDDGIVATFTSGDARLIAMAVGPVLLTAAVAIPIRRRLTRNYRRKLDAGSRYDRPAAGGGTTT